MVAYFKLEHVRSLNDLYFRSTYSWGSCSLPGWCSTPSYSHRYTSPANWRWTMNNDLYCSLISKGYNIYFFIIGVNKTRSYYARGLRTPSKHITKLPPEYIALKLMLLLSEHMPLHSTCFMYNLLTLRGQEGLFSKSTF